MKIDTNSYGVQFQNTERKQQELIIEELSICSTTCQFFSLLTVFIYQSNIVFSKVIHQYFVLNEN